MENVDKNKKLYILLGVLLIIVFVIITNLIKSNLNSTYDYGKISSGQDLMQNAAITYDRETYYVLDGIITKFVASYSSSDNSSDSVKYSDYFTVLDESYRNWLGKKKFDEVAEKFLKKFTYISEGDMDSNEAVVTTNIIRGIYDMGDSRYICVVGILNSSDYGYIGIKLNSYDKTYEIFYLE